MSRLERQAAHVDVVRRVESGHVLVVESRDLEELVGEVAYQQERGWRLAGPIGAVLFDLLDRELRNSLTPVNRFRKEYLATLVRGVPGSPLGMDMQGGE